MRVLGPPVLLIASLFGSGLAMAAEQPPSAAQMMDDLMYGRGPVGGPFTLTDQNGQTRSDGEFRGKLMVVYFGYTYCPDICPADLMAITQALDTLGPAAADVQPLNDPRPHAERSKVMIHVGVRLLYIKMRFYITRLETTQGGTRS